jgi:hypothetical protein
MIIARSGSPLIFRVPYSAFRIIQAPIKNILISIDTSKITKVITPLTYNLMNCHNNTVNIIKEYINTYEITNDATKRDKKTK